MMSKKCKYALKALVKLGKHFNQGKILTSEISESENIPKKFLEQILLELKHKGYVGSQSGYGGGYFLKKHPSEITFTEIYRLFDGPIALVPCVSLNYYDKCIDCADENTCIYKAQFEKIREQTRLIMNETTIQSFIDG